MRIQHSWLIRTSCVVAAIAVLGSCSSMSERECLATDWRTIGYEDGVAGYSGDHIGRYRKACSEHGVTPNLSEYQQGRDEGLREFCKPLNGFRVGARGEGYSGVCPAELDQPFVDAYQSGRQLHTLRSRVGATAREIDSLHAELERIDSDLVSVGAQILDSATTNDQRAQLLIDSKHMAERKGEIKARIPQLENQLALYQHDLDNYRSSLPYVE